MKTKILFLIVVLFFSSFAFDTLKVENHTLNVDNTNIELYQKISTFHKINGGVKIALGVCCFTYGAISCLNNDSKLIPILGIISTSTFITLGAWEINLAN